MTKFLFFLSLKNFLKLVDCFFYLFIYYLAALGLSCNIQDLRHPVQDLQLRQAGSLLAACKFLVMACEI